MPSVTSMGTVCICCLNSFIMNRPDMGEGEADCAKCPAEAAERGGQRVMDEEPASHWRVLTALHLLLYHN